MQSLLFLLIFLAKLIQFLLVLTHCTQKLSISLLSRKEFMHHFLDITIASRRSYLLESIFQMSILIHFIVHFLFEKLTPEFLNLEVSPCSNLTLISVFIRSSFSDLLLLLDAINSLLKGLFFVLDTILQTNDPFVPLLLLVFNVFH